MVDFSEALKSRVESMSPDELAATEVRRLSREADRTALLTLDGLWEPPSGDKAAVSTKTVSVRVDVGAAGLPDILRIDQGAKFHESILLIPQAYRLLAGGLDGDGKPQARYVVHAGAAGQDKVTVDRATLAVIVARERPVEMARAHRLVALELRAPVHLTPAERMAQFEDKWVFDIVSLRIDGAASKVSTRALMLLTKRDHVALWVRKDDLVAGPGRILGSALAAAIVSPQGARTRPDVLLRGSAAASGDPYIRHSFGSGPERSLILDVAQIRKMIAGMTDEEARETALTLFEELVDRSEAIGRERVGRGRTGALRSCGHGSQPQDAKDGLRSAANNAMRRGA